MFTAWKSDGTFDLAPRSAAEPRSTAHLQPVAVNTSPRPAPHEASSIINEWLTMRGELETEGDILVKGRVHGNVRCRLLIVDTGGLIEGSVTADDVVIRGSARGTIKTKKIRLEKTAVVDCEIFHDSFAAEEGARVKGSLRTNEDPSGAAIAAEGESAPQNEAATPEAKVSSALYQMLDVARTPGRNRTAAAS